MVKVKNLTGKLDEWLKSPEANIYFEKKKKDFLILTGRYKRFEVWLENNDFDKLMYRIILEHGDNWLDKCWHNGIHPFPNNKLKFIIGYVTKDDFQHPLKNDSLDADLDVDFPSEIWEFKGYYFQFIHGQGTIIRIYNKDDLRLLLQL